MSPLALAAGQHHLAIEDLVAPNAGHGQPVALAAKICDLLVFNKGDRPEALLTALVRRGSSIEGKPSGACGRNETLTLPTVISGLQLPVPRNQRCDVTAALDPTGKLVSTGGG